MLIFNKQINWDKYYSDDEEERKEEAKHVFVYVSTLDYKHSLLVSGENKTKPNREKDKRRPAPNGLGHLGFNWRRSLHHGRGSSGAGERLKTDYHNSFCSDGFFWGQQWQENAVSEYKAQDKKFIEWCKEQIKNKKVPIYTCSW